MKLDSLSMMVAFAFVMMFAVLFTMVNSCNRHVMTVKCKEACGSPYNVLVVSQDICVCKNGEKSYATEFRKQ